MDVPFLSQFNNYIVQKCFIFSILHISFAIPIKFFLSSNMNDFKRSTLGERTCFLRRKKRSESAFSLGGYNSEIGEKAALQDSDLLEMCGKRTKKAVIFHDSK